MRREMLLLMGKQATSAAVRRIAFRILTVTGGISEPDIDSLLKSGDEDLVTSTLLQAIEQGELRSPPANPARPFDQADAGAAAPLLKLIQSTSSAKVLLAVCSSLPRLDSRTRIMTAKAVIGRLGGFQDRTLNLMAWYGLSEETSSAALMYAVSTEGVPPMLLRFAVRRIAQLKEMREAILGGLLSAHGPAKTVDDQIAALTGLMEGYRGQLRPVAPQEWAQIQKRLMASPDATVVELTRKVSALFGDGSAIDDLRKLVADRNGDHAGRSQAIAALADIQDADSLNIFLSLLNDRAVYVDVAKALAAFDDPRIPKELLKRWESLRHGAKEAATDTLCSRKSYAAELVQALDDGRVSSSDLTATQVRQLLSFNDEAMIKIIEARWGVINESSAAKASAIAGWKETLTTTVLQSADLENGAALFRKTCAACHKLYGDGGKIGPDLTGSNRANMDYVLNNVIDPSAEVPRQFTVSVIALKSGRIVTGVVVGETEQTLSIQTDKELLQIPVSEVEERTRTTRSLMPDGLLDPLTKDQVRDLIGFVQQRR